MNSGQSYEQFDFLTPDRIHAIQQGLISSNGDYDNILDGWQHLHERLNNCDKGKARRPSFVAHLLEAMSDDGAVSEFDTWNMQGLVFDRKYACRFNKVRSRLDSSQIGKSRVIRESEQYRKARELPSQQNLFFADETDSEVPPPLSDMVLIDVGYYVRDEKVEELYFLLHDEHTVLAMKIVSLYDLGSATATDQKEVPHPQLKLKILEEREGTT